MHWRRVMNLQNLNLERRWNELINTRRIGVDYIQEDPSYRTAFQRDFDRIIFSAAFRRLQDKTQVFPLAQTDYVRTRLTHSLEVSSVCRSLGTMLGEYLIEKYHFDEELTPSSIGAILAAGALGHDIGNPPFGHAGEEAIRRFFATHESGVRAIEHFDIARQNDFLNFEGNAQGFRLLTHLQNSGSIGGLQLSLPVIASFTKYPCSSYYQGERTSIAFAKYNYFQAEKALFEEFAQGINLLPVEGHEGAWYRHPFAYLLEAADDICYCLVDIEDAYRLGIIEEGEAKQFYQRIIETHTKFPSKYDRISREKERMEYLRAFTIGILIDEVIATFKENEALILSGRCEKELLEMVPSASVIADIKQFAYEKIYISPPVLEVGIAGFKVLETLLEAFVTAINSEYSGRSSSHSRMLVNFLPDQFLGENRTIDEDPYLRILRITDFLSGMTDRYAVKVFKMISGVDLPA